MPPLAQLTDKQRYRRTAYIKGKNENGKLDDAAVKQLAKDQGITKEAFLEKLHLGDLMIKANKKWQTRNARNYKRRKQAPPLSSEQLFNHLTQLVEKQQAPKPPQERMIQVSFRIFREIDEQSIRHEETRKNGKTFAPHEYIEDDGNILRETASFYMGETDIIKMTLPWKYIHDDVRKVSVDIMLNRSVIRERASIQDEALNEFLETQQDGINDAATRSIQQVKEYYKVILVIEGYEDVSNSRNPLNPRKMQLLEQDTRMSSKFLKYEINKNATTLYNLFKADKYYRPNSCLANAIMNLVADRYNAKYSTKPRCTYEFLWSLAFPNAPYDGKRFAMSFDEAIPIFRYFRIRAEQRHSNTTIEAQYHPKDDGIKIDTFLGGQYGLSLVYIRKDNHAFAVNDSGTKHSLALKSIVVEDNEIKPSTRFPIPTGKSILVGGVASIEQLIVKILEEQDKVENNETRFIKILWCSPVNLSKILEHMMVECNYHPNITTKKGFQIESITFGVGDIFVNLARANFGEETMITSDLTSMGIDECLRYQELKEKCMKTMIKPYMKSQYGEGFLQALRTYKRGALNGYFKLNGSGAKAVGLDTIKCYPSILRDLRAIPVFSKFDKFMKYKGEKISEFSLYYVKRKRKYEDNEYVLKVLMNNKWDVIYGKVLKKIKDEVDILAVCTPSRLYENPFGEIIDEVFSDDVLSESVKKQILVSCIGHLGKILGYATRQRLYSTIDDAVRDQEKFGGCVSFIGVGEGFTDYKGITHYKKKIFILQQSKSVEMEDGFLPIQSLIYDNCRLKLAETIEMVLDAGCKPLGVKTDCVFVSESDAEKLSIPLKSEINGCDIKNIGKLKKEMNQRSPRNPISFQQWDDCDVFNEPTVNIHTLENEYGMEEFNNIFDKFDKIMIKAKHAGSGKSYACKKYLVGKKHAIACPQNAQARKLQLDGFNAMTLYDLCGSRPTDDNGIQQRTAMKNDYDVVVFEEIGQYTIKEWGMVMRYMEKFPHIKIIANGDELQNDPIEHNFNPSIKPETYYTRIVNTLFKEQIMLEIPKRYKAYQCERVKQLREDLFISNLPIEQIINKYAMIINNMNDIPKDCAFVTYRQETRKQINQWEHQRRGLQGFFEGLIIRANCHKSLKNTAKNTRINKHFDYKITRIDKTSFDLMDESSGLEYKSLPKSMLRDFSYPYAYTGHSLQGDTIDKRIVIFDAHFERVTRKWLYVALTRGSDMDCVYVFEGKKVIQIPEADIDNKIVGYMRQDGARIISKNYIDVPWVLQKSKSQMHRCSCCSEVMNMENDGSMLDWTVDRIDSDKTHTKDNCTLMCWHCNISKKDNIIV